MKQSWWRRNWLALVALIVLLPATLLVVAGTEWRDYFVRPYSEPVFADEDGIVEFAGNTWGPADVRTLKDSTGLNLPDGAKVIVGLVPVVEDTPGDAAPTCDSPILVSQRDGRQWTEMRNRLGLEDLASEPTRCDAEVDGEPYRILAPFVVPEDVEGPFWLDVRVAGQETEFIRFSVDF